LVIERDLRQKH